MKCPGCAGVTLTDSYENLLDAFSFIFPFCVICYAVQPVTLMRRAKCCCQGLIDV